MTVLLLFFAILGASCGINLNQSELFYYLDQAATSASENRLYLQSYNNKKPLLSIHGEGFDADIPLGQIAPFRMRLP